jgi:hypothetical protein
MAPGPDIDPYHDRQIAILDRADWAAWLDPSASAKTILKPLPPGALTVQQVGWANRKQKARPESHLAISLSLRNRPPSRADGPLAAMYPRKGRLGSSALIIGQHGNFLSCKQA